MPVDREHLTPDIELLRPLAEGSMGRLWIARHHLLGVEVAVKLIALEALDDENRQRFEREARAAAAIAGDHVVRVLEQGHTARGEPYMAMELLDGEPLADRLERERRIALDDVVAIVSQLGSALSRAHAAGIVHRDVKPSNVFLTRTASGVALKLLDFGVAKWLNVDGPGHDLTADGNLVGTPHYMSPEQILHGGGKLSPQADLWSLAVLAYECLAGRRPFEAATLNDLSLVVFGSRYPPLTEIRPDLSPAFDVFFARAFRKKATDRYGDVGAMVAAFADVARRHVGYDEDAATAPRRAYRDPD